MARVTAARHRAAVLISATMAGVEALSHRIMLV